MKTLTGETLERELRSLPKWRLEGGAIVRQMEFPAFAGAVAYVNRVAAEAEAANHHPDIDIRYNRVKLTLVSHDAGGLTERDIHMARTLDKLDPA